MRQLGGRLHRLEFQVEAEEQAGRTHVLRIGPDGCPEVWPDMGPNDRVIALPRKAASVAQWQQWCAVILADREDWLAEEEEM
jgi:hypothetical protein